MKKQVMFALLGLLTLSILPGCGKSKNDEGVIVGGGGVFVPGATGGVTFSSNGCFDLRYSTPGQPVTLYFQGQGYVSYASGRVYSYTRAAQSGAMPGVTHSRSNIAGDSLQVYVPSTSSTTTYAVATLASSTVAVINQYWGGFLCGIDTAGASSSGGVMIESAYFIGLNGDMSYGPYGITL